MSGFRPDRNERKERRRIFVFANGYQRGITDERERIISDLLKDAVVITNLDARMLERIVDIVEG
jgi:hypothetical protein